MKSQVLHALGISTAIVGGAWLAYWVLDGILFREKRKIGIAIDKTLTEVHGESDPEVMREFGSLPQLFTMPEEFSAERFKVTVQLQDESNEVVVALAKRELFEKIYRNAKVEVICQEGFFSKRRLNTKVIQILPQA